MIRFVWNQEEAVGKQRKLRKLSTMYLQAKSELEDLREEQARELEGLLESTNQVERELGFHNIIIDQYIPKPYQASINLLKIKFTT